MSANFYKSKLICRMMCLAKLWDIAIKSPMLKSNTQIQGAYVVSKNFPEFLVIFVIPQFTKSCFVQIIANISWVNDSWWAWWCNGKVIFTTEQYTARKSGQ